MGEKWGLEPHSTVVRKRVLRTLTIILVHFASLRERGGEERIMMVCLLTVHSRKPESPPPHLPTASAKRKEESEAAREREESEGKDKDASSSDNIIGEGPV